MPYVAEVDAQSIYVTYLKDLPTTTVEIFNETGECVYRTTVNPVSDEHLFINIGDWSEGFYTIYFNSHRTNQVIFGEFEL